MKTPLKLLAALAFAFASLTSTRAADIDGKWRAEFESQVGKQTYVFDLKAGADGKLTGKAAFERMEQKGETELKDGKIAKDEVSFSETVKLQDQEIRIDYKGKIVGDELKLHRKVGDLVEYDIVAKREKPAVKK
jgi:Zn/Cd-binding protein ZinT